MFKLGGIVARIKGNDCNHSIKQVASEISFTVPSVDASGMGVAKINVGHFSRKVVELVKARDTAVSLDELQYQLCQAIQTTRDNETRRICERVRLQIFISFQQFSTLIEAIKTDPNPEVRKKLVEWLEYSSDLSNHAITALDPTSTTRGVRPHHSLGEITRYQNLTEPDIQEAVRLLIS